MQIDVAIDQLKVLLAFLKSYRENGFVTTSISVKEIATQIIIELVFHGKGIIRRKNNLRKMILMR